MDDTIVNAGEIDSILDMIIPILNDIGVYSTLPKAIPPKRLPSRELVLSGDTDINAPRSLPSVVTLIDIDQIGTKK